MSTTHAPTATQEDIERIVHGDHWDPTAILGLHPLTISNKPAQVIRAFLPEAENAWVIDLSKGEPGVRVPMDLIHPDGFLNTSFPIGPKPSPIGWRSKTTKDIRGISLTLTDSALF